MFTAKAAIEAVISNKQVEHRCDENVAVFRLDALGRNLANQHAWMAGAREMIVLAIAEIREADVGKLVFVIGECQLQVGLGAVRLLFLEIPFALFAPAESDGATRHDDAL